jgi:L-amino acid N-acyltransferase YncA
VTGPAIRLATPADAEQVLAIYTPHCETATSFELAAPTVGDMAGRIARVLEWHPWLVCEASGEVLGYAYASRHRERPAYRWSVETSVYVGSGHRRLGVGRALYASLLAVLPLQGYVSAFAGVTLPNPASVGLHEALGFQEVGVYRHAGYKCGAWHDVVWYQRLLQEPPEDPPAPLPLADVACTTAYAAALQAGLTHLRG